MAVSIIGAGAIGLLFAAKLRQAGIDVTLYTRTEKQANMLKEKGICFCFDEKEERISVNASKLAAKTNLLDTAVIIAVKQHQLNDVFPILQQNSQGKIFLFVQNGMGHLAHLAKLRQCQIFLGAVEHGAAKACDNKVIHTGVGKTKIAAYSSMEQNALPSFMHLWSSEHFPIEYQSDWHQMLAAKLAANAVINPLTAIFRITNGTLLTNSYYKYLMRKLFDEAYQALQPKLNETELWNYVINVCEQTANNHSSMLKDLQAGRRTEIDAISGYILEKAKKQQIDAPYTTFVFHSIKAQEYVDL